MNLRLILLAVAATLAFVACPAPTSETPTPQPSQPSPPTPPTPPPTTPPPNPPTPPTPPPSDTTAPTIVSVSPDNAENGVEANAKIRIEFSEPMNQAATEAAYQSTDMPSVTFAWSPNGRKLEIDPVGDLEYGNLALTPAGRVYGFTIQNTAKDLAGNALPPLTSTFKTLYRITRTLSSVAALDGYIEGDGDVKATDTAILVGDGSFPNNAQIKGFLSFSLTILAQDGLTNPERITSAKLRIFQPIDFIGSPYTDLQLGGRHLLAAHIVYGPTLNFVDFNSAILHNLGEISRDDAIEYKQSDTALESVRNDWAERTRRDDRSQFMLFFPLSTNGDDFMDTALFNSREEGSNPPQLEITYLIPNAVP
jgi:Bacterial Ig-like domain